jgi:hypothetical protein
MLRDRVESYRNVNLYNPPDGTTAFAAGFLGVAVQPIPP